ncbi:MAG: outer membrane protein assembly factor BamA [Chitinivibrionales bacterium]|nr:outer membrane protein assembly factor BamA [Chitinivibrionales bacterium]
MELVVHWLYRIALSAYRSSGRGKPRWRPGAYARRASILTVLLVALIFSCANRGWLVRTVDFSGNKTFSRRKLLDRMVTKPSSPVDWVPYSRNALEDDVKMLQSFYRNQGFLRANVELHHVRLDSSRKFAHVTVLVEEGNRTYVQALHIDGNTTVDGQALRKRLKTEPGKPLVGTRIDDDRRRISAEYSKEGYLQTQVQPTIELEDNRDSASVTLQVVENQPSTVDTVIIDGLDRVRERLVRRELQFEQDDTLTSSRISGSIRNMYQTDLFRTVSVKPILRDSGGEPIDSVPKRVDVEVEEDDLLDLSVGVGYGTEDQLRGSADILYRNLFGLGKRVSLEAKASFIEQQVKAVYTDPRFLGLPGRFDLSGHFTHFDDDRSYAARYGGGKAALSFDTRFRLAYGIGFRWEEVRYLWATGGDSLSDKPTQSVSLNATYDQRDDLFNPTKGFYTAARAEVAGLGGPATSQFYRLKAGVRGYVPIRSKWVLSSAATIGYGHEYGDTWVNDSTLNLPPRERFYAGGNSSIRGFKTRMVGPLTYDDGALKPTGGRVLIELHLLELRYPIYKMLNGTVFLDAGTVANSWGEIRDKGIRYSAGFGLNLASALGIVRADIAFPLNRNPYLTESLKAMGASREVPLWYHIDIGHAF